jgi:chaperonin GroES
MAVELTNSFDVSKKVPFLNESGDIVAPVVELPIQSELKEEKKLKLRPLVDRVLVRVLPETDELQNGLVIPDEAKEKPQSGVVLAVGKGRIVNGERIPVDVSVGAVIVFGRYSGNEIKFLGEKLLLLQESELMGEYYAE